MATTLMHSGGDCSQRLRIAARRGRVISSSMYSHVQPVASIRKA